MRTLILIFMVPLFCQAQVDQAKTLYEAKKYDEAKKLLTSVKSDNKQYGQAQYYLGRIAYDQKDLDAAEDFLEEAIDTNDKVADYHYWMGNVLGSMARDANVLRQGMLASKVKDEFEAAVALDPSLVDAHWGLLSFYLEAPAVMGGSFDKAKREAEAIRKSNEADGHRAYGRVYEKQELFDKAEQEYKAAYKANPLYTNPLVNFYTSRKQTDKALNFLEELMKTDPNNMLLQYQYGRTTAITGQRMDKGEQCLTKYLGYTPKENEPSHAGAQMRLAQISEKFGRKAEAKKRYEASLQLDPSLKDAKEGLARVSK